MKYTNAQPIQWRIDDDGIMRITMCILKEGVYDYNSDEVPPEAGLAGKEVIKQYIPASEFSKDLALQSIEGKPIVVDEHEWRNAENTLKDELTVGNVAGSALVQGTDFIVDALVYDKETQEKVKSGELVEVSAGYDGDLEVGAGEYNGEPFDATQTNFRFNHVLLLPKGYGRLGSKVRIINKNPEGVAMSCTLKVRIGNASRSYRFSNEADREVAEEMLQEERTFNASELEATIQAKQEIEAQLDELKAQLAQHDEHLQSAKAEIERLLSPEVQENMAQEFSEQVADEDEVIENEVENAVDLEGLGADDAVLKKESFCNSIRVGGMAQRRKNTVDAVFANRGQKVGEKWTQEVYDGAFETLVVTARVANKARKENRARFANQTPNTKTTAQYNNAGNNMSHRDRVLRPMKGGQNG